MKDDVNNLSHSKWNCKYHIVFAPKYRRKAIYGQLRKDIGRILRQLCEFKEVYTFKQGSLEGYPNLRKLIEDKPISELIYR